MIDFTSLFLNLQFLNENNFVGLSLYCFQAVDDTWINKGILA